MSSLPKISAVMCTYRRHSYVERAMNCFLAQDYGGEKELIIYNTDEEHPYWYAIRPSFDFRKPLIYEPDKIVYKNDSGVLTTIIFKNCGIDQKTLMPYTNVGAVRRDSLSYATGDYYVCFDDDDMYLPWMFRQAIDRMAVTGLPFFKPEKSFFYSGGNLRLVKNTLEASVVGRMDKIREYGFGLSTATEGLSWYTPARDNKELDENDSYYLPAYCFDWHTNLTGGYIHRQSGNPDNPKNFDEHKEASKDICNRDLMIKHKDWMREMYDIYFQYILDSPDFDLTLTKKYLTPNL